MESPTIIPPVVLFQDDGVNIHVSAEKAELELEAIDIKDNPEWRGFDSHGHGIRLDVVVGERDLFFGLMKTKQEMVKLRLDPSITLEEASETMLDQMCDYLLGVDSRKTNGSTRSSAREMLHLILEKADAK